MAHGPGITDRESRRVSVKNSTKGIVRSIEQFFTLGDGRPYPTLKISSENRSLLEGVLTELRKMKVEQPFGNYGQYSCRVEADAELNERRNCYRMKVVNYHLIVEVM